MTNSAYPPGGPPASDGSANSGYPANPNPGGAPYVPPGSEVVTSPEKKPAEPAPTETPINSNPADGVIFNAPVPKSLRNTRQFYPNWEKTNRYGGSQYIKKHGLNGTGFIVRDVSMNDQLKNAATNGWAKAVESWGFQFHFNPSTFSESFTPPDGMDWAGFLQDIAFNPMLIQGHQGNSQISFQILLARMEDQKLLLREDWKSLYDGGFTFDNEDRQEILETGTQYDIERFFRVVNLDPVMTWRGKTSDWGMMMAIPVMVFLGDSTGSRKFRAQISSFSIQHQLYVPGMIPVYSQINIAMQRIPDPYGANATTPGGETAVPSAPAPEVPNPYQGTPTSTRDKNIQNALPIFNTWVLRGNKWDKGDWDDLVKLWDKESNWNHKAENKRSSTYTGKTGTGAYGIPQAMPGTKMKSKGADWMTNPSTQVMWGLDYIKDRYGSPTAAWKHSQKFNWY